jgi:hypothetical protein
MKDFPSLSAEEIVLERSRLVAQGSLGRSVIDSMQVRSSDVFEYMADRLTFQLRAEVLSRPLGRIVYSFPATPWDHWKQKWLPRLGVPGRWYLRRHPVRESAKAFSAAAIFPEANVVYPRELGAVKFALAPEVYFDAD